MHDLNFVVREPLLDTKQQIIGYELTVQQPESDREIVTPADDFRALASYICHALQDEEGKWLLKSHRIFLRAEPSILECDEIQALPAKRVVLSVRLDDLADLKTLASVKKLRAKGLGIALRDATAIAQDKTMLSIATHIEIEFATTDFPTQAKIYGALKNSSVRMVARQISTWKEYDSCSSLGLDAFIGNLYLTPRDGEALQKSKGLNPAQGMILQLMDMVRKNADVRQLEDILKRDAALSYKLLQYINSAGFGLGTEIQSLRHAVTMLGYSPLYRWLSVLLATATVGGQSAILMQTAIVRARFAELLGVGLLPHGESENLFVAGMFSLLDRLLGVSMDEVLDNIQLSEPITQALLHRDGMFGPFLRLAEAGECNNGPIAELAESLFISPDKVNEAHSSALVWAQNLGL
jgi:c-di-GMP-related signal transduction protein